MPATFSRDAAADTGRPRLGAPGVMASGGEVMGGLGRRDPSWPAKRQKVRGSSSTLQRRSGRDHFCYCKYGKVLRGGCFFPGMPQSSHVTCVRCFRPGLDRISCLKLTFCPGEPFSPSKPGTPWVEEKTEAVTAQNMQRPILEGTVTAPAWAE